MARARSLVLLALPVLVVATLAALGVRALSNARRERVGGLMGELAMCLVGPERPDPAEAEVTARRWLAFQRRHAKDCAARAEALSTEKAVQGTAPGAVAPASDLASALQRDELGPSVGAFFEAAAQLPWVVPAGSAKAQPPVPVVDRDLEALRAAWPQHLVIRSDEPGAVRFAVDGKRALEVVAGDAGALSGVTRGVWPDPRKRLSAEVRDGHAFAVVHGDVAGEVDLGEATFAAAVGSWAFALRDGELIARRHLGELRFGPARSMSVPSGVKGRLVLAGCPTPRGLIVAATARDEGWVGLLLAEGDRASSWPWLKLDPIPDAGMLGTVRPTCHPGGVRAAWSVSEPTVKSEPMGTAADPIPQGPQGFRVETLRCEVDGACVHAMERLTGLDPGWAASGGYGASFSLIPPDAVDLGRSVALIWSGWSGLQLRMAAPGELSAAPSRVMVEVEHRRAPAVREPRALSYHDVQLSSWDDTVLVAVQEREPQYASFVLRADAAGSVRALRP